MPKLITSARESISRPKSLVVCVRRAIIPSSPSNSTANPMAFAAISKSSAAPALPAMAPRKERKIERYPRKMLNAVNSVGSAYAARRGRRSGECRSISGFLSLGMHQFPSFHHQLPGFRQVLAGKIATTRNHAGSRQYPRSRLDKDLPLRAEKHIHARAELDQADALALGHQVAGLLVEYDAPGNQAGDLLEDYRGTLAPHGDHVLFVFRGALLAARHVKLPLAVAHLGDGAGDRRAIHVHVENVQEDADARLGGGLPFQRHHLAIGRRYRHRTGRNQALRIAEEVKTKCRQNEQWQSEPRVRQVGHQQPARGQPQRVVYTVGDDHSSPFSHKNPGETQGPGGRDLSRAGLQPRTSRNQRSWRTLTRRRRSGSFLGSAGMRSVEQIPPGFIQRRPPVPLARLALAQGQRAVAVVA